MNTAVNAFVIALLFSVPALAEPGFEEFEHSTVDRRRVGYDCIGDRRPRNP